MVRSRGLLLGPAHVAQPTRAPEPCSCQLLLTRVLPDRGPRATTAGITRDPVASLGAQSRWHQDATEPACQMSCPPLPCTGPKGDRAKRHFKGDCSPTAPSVAASTPTMAWFKLGRTHFDESLQSHPKQPSGKNRCQLPLFACQSVIQGAK